MTPHAEQTIRTLLDILIDPLGVDGGLESEPLLHGAVRIKAQPPATMDEFEAALAFCSAKKWITSVRGETGRLRWKVTDLGRAARKDLQ